MALVLRAALTDQPISLREHEDLVAISRPAPSSGFVGVVRDHDGGRGVLRLEYSAHPSAAQVLADVVAEVAEQSSGVRAIAASHRIGALQIGDAALVAAVAADHRQAAFATCAEAGRHHQGAATGVEAPVLRRRSRRVGGLGLV